MPPSPSATTLAEPQKKRRGRPRKGEERPKPPANNIPAVKKKRGRPKKIVSAESASVITDAESTCVVASAPAEASNEQEPPVKKKRGRPRKVVASQTQGTATVDTAQIQGSATVDTAENGKNPPAKKKRGRPRKTPTAATPTEKVSGADRGSMDGEAPPTQTVTIAEQGSVEGESAASEPQALPSQGEAPSDADKEENEQDVMGKLQVSFSESESECSDPMDLPRSTIDALTNRVAPPKPAPQQNSSPLFLDNQFEESFDEDSDN